MNENRKNIIRSKDANMMAILHDNSPFVVKEAYNHVRARLFAETKGKKCPIIAVTSAKGGDGKTISAINLAISISRTGKKVLVIDADLRNPSLHKIFGLKRSKGLSNLLMDIKSEISFHKVPFPNMYVLVAGSTTTKPAETIGNVTFTRIVELLADRFDYIIIDTPPVGIVSDAALLSEMVTGYVIVVRSNYTDVVALKNAVRTLNELNCNIFGFVLNDVDEKELSYRNRYSYGYEYGGI